MASENLTYYRDCGSGKALLGAPSTIGSQGPGGGGVRLTSKGWSALLKRMTRREQITANPGNGYQVFDGANAEHDPSAFYPLFPPNNLIYRIRAGIAAEYVSGTGVSRVGWGVMKGWSDAAGVGANPTAPADIGFLGFLWYQTGSTAVNWRALAADHAGVNQFDKDTGKTAPGIPYNMRIDFDNRIGKRKILWFIDDVEVASFTPGDGVLGGTSTQALRFGLGVNARDSNVCAGHTQMLGEHGWELLVTDGVAT